MIWAIVFYVLSVGDPGVIDHPFKSEKECNQFLVDNPPPKTVHAFCIELDSI